MVLRRERNRAELRPLHPGDAVVPGQPLVHHREVAVEEAQHRQVGPDDLSEELDRLPPRRGLQVVVVLLVDVPVGRHPVEVSDPEPLAGEVPGELGGLRVGQHPLDLGPDRGRVAELAGRSRAGQLGVRGGAPQEVREPDRQLLVGQAAGAGGLLEVQEPGRAEDSLDSGPDGGRERQLARGPLLRDPPDDLGHLGRGDRPPVRPGEEAGEDLRQVGVVGPVGAGEEQLLVPLRGPLHDRALEAHRLDPEAGEGRPVLVLLVEHVHLAGELLLDHPPGLRVGLLHLLAERGDLRRRLLLGERPLEVAGRQHRLPRRLLPGRVPGDDLTGGAVPAELPRELQFGRPAAEVDQGLVVLRGVERGADNERVAGRHRGAVGVLEQHLDLVQGGRPGARERPGPEAEPVPPVRADVLLHPVVLLVETLVVRGPVVRAAGHVLDPAGLGLEGVRPVRDVPALLGRVPLRVLQPDPEVPRAEGGDLGQGQVLVLERPVRVLERGRLPGVGGRVEPHVGDHRLRGERPPVEHQVGHLQVPGQLALVDEQGRRPAVEPLDLAVHRQLGLDRPGEVLVQPEQVADGVRVLGPVEPPHPVPPAGVLGRLLGRPQLAGHPLDDLERGLRVRPRLLLGGHGPEVDVVDHLLPVVGRLAGEEVGPEVVDPEPGPGRRRVVALQAVLFEKRPDALLVNPVPGRVAAGRRRVCGRTGSGGGQYQQQREPASREAPTAGKEEARRPFPGGRPPGVLVRRLLDHEVVGGVGDRGWVKTEGQSVNTYRCPGSAREHRRLPDWGALTVESNRPRVRGGGCESIGSFRPVRVGPCGPCGDEALQLAGGSPHQVQLRGGHERVQKVPADCPAPQSPSARRDDPPAGGGRSPGSRGGVREGVRVAGAACG